ncbi:MAG TPA: FMN-binding protein [Sporichthyaceae bacterium]|jgi:uncharacterized protein with FMN-binding domain|nr:FMN-binding protein [Sporichthyaceae bacterium]
MVSRARPNAGRRNAAMAAATGLITGLLFLYPTSFGHSTGVAAAAPKAVLAPGRVVETNPATTPDGSGTTGAAASGGSRTVTGSAAQTRYGPVQVQITVSGGRIVAAEAIEYPSESGRDRQINQVAVPELNQAVLGAQSAGIDTVSGATYTSIGYVQSLQSALDAANIKT